jgi:hypothetical protein
MADRHGEFGFLSCVSHVRCSTNGASPQPDEPCLGQLLLPEQAHAGTRGQSDRPPPPATPRYVTSTRSAYMQVRCAVVALWSEHHRRYAHQIRPASTKLDSILPTSSDLAWLAVEQAAAYLDQTRVSPPVTSTCAPPAPLTCTARRVVDHQHAIACTVLACSGSSSSLVLNV